MLHLSMSTVIGGALFFVCYYHARFAGELIKAKIASQWIRSIIGTIRTMNIARATTVKWFIQGGCGRNESFPN
jgi:hypothetical protein